MRVDLARNTLYAGVGNASNVLLLVLLILAGRTLGVDDFGAFSFALAFGMIVAHLSELGLAEILRRTLAREPALASRHVGNVLCWKALLGLATLALVAGAAPLLADSPDVRLALLLLSAAMILKTGKRAVLAAFQAFERFDLAAFSLAGHNTLLLAGGAAALLATGSLVALAWTFLVVRALDLVITIAVFHLRVAPIEPGLDPRLVRDVQVEAFSLGIFALIIEVEYQVDSVMLALISSDEQVGLYNAAFKLVDGLLVLPMVLYQAISPQLARLFRTSHDDYRTLAARAVKYALVASILLAACGVAVSEEVVALLFGSGYAGAVPSLHVLLTAFPFVCLNFLAQSYLISIDQQRALMPIGLGALAVNVGANALLIPALGSFGAALATVLSSAVAVFWAFQVVGTRFRPIGVLLTAGRPLLAIALASGVVLVFAPSGGLAYLLVASPLYLALLFALGVFGREERDFARGLWSRIA